MKNYKIKLTEEELDTISTSVLKDKENKEAYLQKLDEDEAYVWNEEYYIEVKSQCELIEKIYKKLIRAEYKF